MGKGRKRDRERKGKRTNKPTSIKTDWTEPKSVPKWSPKQAEGLENETKKIEEASKRNQEPSRRGWKKKDIEPGGFWAARNLAGRFQTKGLPSLNFPQKIGVMISPRIADLPRGHLRNLHGHRCHSRENARFFFWMTWKIRTSSLEGSEPHPKKRFSKTNPKKVVGVGHTVFGYNFNPNNTVSGEPVRWYDKVDLVSFMNIILETFLTYISTDYSFERIALYDLNRQLNTTRWSI